MKELPRATAQSRGSGPYRPWLCGFARFCQALAFVDFIPRASLVRVLACVCSVDVSGTHAPSIRTRISPMTFSSSLAGSFVEPQVIRKQYAMEMAVERTRMLYQGSLLPTLLMLLNGLVCAGLLWDPQRYVLVSVWLVWLLLLVALRVIQVAAFDSAMPSRQAQPIWRRMFLLGSALSGLTLAAAGIALVPTDSFLQQAWVFGLIGAATLCASVAYAVSLSAFLSFTLPCLLPATGYLFWGGDQQQQGWGWLGLILLGSLSVVAWQVNRLIGRGCVAPPESPGRLARCAARLRPGGAGRFPAPGPG